ncbi:MAG: ZIP family metal transporter, partial [Ardenticatenales bacterium]
PGQQLALLIAVGLGLHNFSEGLAIGQSAASGTIAFALTLIIGFGLHNITEGFGIAAPMASDGARPTWGYLLLLGVVGGGPTFVGTVLGYSFTSEAVFVLFLTLAAGALIYVIDEMLAVGHAILTRGALYSGLLLGFFAGFGTDLLLKYLGG